jgi:hypothetical protein
MEIRSIRWVLAFGLAAGCGGASAGGTTEGITGSNQKNIPKVDSDLCDTTGKQVQTFDLNQDDTPDVWKLYATVEEQDTKIDVLTCKQVDYDHDGKKDYVAIYNRTGELVAEEFDFTFDGRFDAREHYDKKGGKIYMVERDLDHNKNPDTWEKYDPDGNLESVERDRNGDGKADLWEQYQRGVLLAILYDDDYDRKVDRKESGRPSSNLPRPAAAPAPAPASTGAAAPAQPERPRGGGLVEETPTAPGQSKPVAPVAKPADGAKPAEGAKPAPKKSGGK